MVAVVLAMLLAAIEATIVATAMPSIADELGGFSYYGWVFSSYLLMQAVTTPIFGKLADIYGRKPVFVGGVGVFLLGSVCCALSPTMPLLIAFRFLQGIGAGAVVPIGVTLAGDLYTLAERPRIQAWMSSVWGVSSVLGPLAGGLIVEHVGWPWIFWLNLPFGALAITMMWLFLHEEIVPRSRTLDLAGAGLLFVGLTSLMLSISLLSVWLLLLSGLCAVFFVRQELRAEDPVIHLDLWKNSLVWRGNLTVLMIGIAMLGLIGFMPTYVQGVLGYSPLVAGFTVSAMCIGWPLAAVTAGHLLLRVPLPTLVRTGSIISTAGALLIALTAARGPLWGGVGCFLVGVGFGVLNTSFLVTIQSTVAWEKRGVATSGNMLMRNLGNSLGAAFLGAVLNHRMAGYLQEQGLAGKVSMEHVRELVGEGSVLDPALLQLIQHGLAEALHLVFWGVLVSVVVGGVFAWGAPKIDIKDPPDVAKSAD
jgi:EmrB/QacA subfamily drug resistance transporter